MRERKIIKNVEMKIKNKERKNWNEKIALQQKYMCNINAMLTLTSIFNKYYKIK